MPPAHDHIVRSPVRYRITSLRASQSKVPRLAGLRMKALSIKTTIAFYLAGMVVVHLAVLWNVRQMIWKGYSDFTIYYCAGTMFRQGLGHELYNDQEQFKVQRQFSPEVATRLGALPYNHPPFEAVLFAPFTYLAYPWAFMLWDFLNLAMLASLPTLLRPYLARFQNCSGPLWLLAGLAFFPVFFALLQGQDSILLLFLYTLTFVDLAKGRDARAGVWLGLGLFKPHLIVPFALFMLLWGRKRLWYGLLLVGAGLGLLSGTVVGWETLRSYPHYVLQLEATMARGAIVPSDMPNLRGVLYLLLRGQHVGAVAAALSVCLFLFAVWRGRHVATANSFRWQFALAVVATVVISYHALGYDLSTLLLPIVLVLAEIQAEARDWPVWLIICAIAVLFFSPLQLFLLLRLNRLALVGWAVLLLMSGIMEKISKLSAGAVTVAP